MRGPFVPLSKTDNSLSNKPGNKPVFDVLAIFDVVGIHAQVAFFGKCACIINAGGEYQTKDVKHTQRKTRSKHDVK